MRVLRTVPMAGLSGPRMGAGVMSQVDVSPESRAVIQRAADALLNELEYQLSRVGEEVQHVAPSTLASDPDSYWHVFRDYEWTPMEIRTQVALDAAALEDVADRLTRGSLMPYLSDSEIARAQSAFVTAQNTWKYLRTLESEPISQAHQEESVSHLEDHLSALDHGVLDLERAVVSAEAGTVPVIEPYERTNEAFKKALAIGGIAVAVLIVVGLAS